MDLLNRSSVRFDDTKLFNLPEPVDDLQLRFNRHQSAFSCGISCGISYGILSALLRHPVVVLLDIRLFSYFGILPSSH